MNKVDNAKTFFSQSKCILKKYSWWGQHLYQLENQSNLEVQKRSRDKNLWWFFTHLPSDFHSFIKTKQKEKNCFENKPEKHFTHAWTYGWIQRRLITKNLVAVILQNYFCDLFWFLITLEHCSDAFQDTEKDSHWDGDWTSALFGTLSASYVALTI